MKPLAILRTPENADEVNAILNKKFGDETFYQDEGFVASDRNLSSIDVFPDLTLTTSVEEFRMAALGEEPESKPDELQRLTELCRLQEEVIKLQDIKIRLQEISLDEACGSWTFFDFLSEGRGFIQSEITSLTEQINKLKS